MSTTESENLDLVNKMEEVIDKEKNTINLSGDILDEDSSDGKSKKINKEESIKKLEEMKTVMKTGMNFLAGMYKMSTGNEIGMEDQKLDINTETGEITMKFKLPV